MFELPEVMNFAKQFNEAIRGKTVGEGHLGNSPHKFVWYNREEDEFAKLTQGKKVGESYGKGRWLFIPLEPGYILLMGEWGGKLLLHSADGELPKKYHLYITFTDGTFLTATTQMWGAFELYEKGEEQDRKYVKDMRPTPIEPAFTFDYFSDLIDSLVAEKKWSAKGLLTQEQVIPGLGNAIAQDILFNAQLHPRHSIATLDEAERRTLYEAIKNTVNAVIDGGGRNDEFDLYNQAGGYVRLMDRHAAGNPCPRCGTVVEKIQYLGGACYLCPDCQR
jgi:formamidopyrimidine-DNA glycosylase